MTVTARARMRASTARTKRFRWAASRPWQGSSRISRRGRLTSARASRTIRWRPAEREKRGLPGKVKQLEPRQPPARAVRWRADAGLEQAHRVVEAGGHHFKAGGRVVEVEVQLGRHPANVPLDLPDGLAAAARSAEDDDVVGIDLGVVAEDEAEQGGLARAVGAEQGPAFSGADGPVEVAQNHGVPIAHGDVAQPDQFGDGPAILGASDRRSERGHPAATRSKPRRWTVPAPRSCARSPTGSGETAEPAVASQRAAYARQG